MNSQRLDAFSNNFNQSENQPKNTLESFTFPCSTKDLWDRQPIGEAFDVGLRFYRAVSLVCMERCVRLAHKHALQERQDIPEKPGHVNGFLIGSLTVDNDELGITIFLDRFDPGIVNSDNFKIPSAPLPNDIAVPICFTFGKPDGPDVAYTFSVEHFECGMKLLHSNVQAQSSPDLNQSVQLRIQCYYNNTSAENNRAELEMHSVALAIASSLKACPVKSVPIIPTALAKNLAGPLNLSYIQGGYKTGYLTMDQTRKILLLLDSDPKIATMPMVGIWVSGVTMIHHPFVWQAALRFMHCTSLAKRTLTEDGEFLVLLHSLACAKPQFFQCKLENSDQLAFDLLFAQHYVHQYKPHEPDSSLKLRFDQLQPHDSRDGEFFLEALDNCGPFTAAAHARQAPRDTQETTKRANLATNHHDNRPTSAAATETSSRRVNVPDDDDTEPQPFRFEPASLQRSMLMSSVTEPSLIFDESSRTYTTSAPRQPPPPAFEPAIPAKRASSTPMSADNGGYQGYYVRRANEAQRTNSPQVGATAHRAPPNQHPPAVGILRQTPPGNAQYDRERRRNGGRPNVPQQRRHKAAEKPSWMRQMPAEAYQLLLQQDSQLKQLQAQIQLVIAAQGDSAAPSSGGVDAAVSARVVAHDVAVGTTRAVTCDRSVQTDDVIIQDVETAPSRPATARSCVTEGEHVTDEKLLAAAADDEDEDQKHVTDDVSGTAPHDADGAADELDVSEDKFARWDSDSLHLADSSALRHDVSVTSALTTVDIPGLDVSGGGGGQGDQDHHQQHVTAASSRANASWNDHMDSPVLGESASMCHVQPGNKPARRSSLDVAAEQAEKIAQNDPKFFGDLLKKVQALLLKGEENPPAQDHETTPTSSKRPSAESKVKANGVDARTADATPPPAMTSSVTSSSTSWNAVEELKANIRSNATEFANSARSMRKFAGGIRTPLIPHLTYLSALADEGLLRATEVSTLFSSRSANELSCHANAIALKYLSDDRLRDIATVTSSSSPSDAAAKPKSQQMEEDEPRMPGMSLISPCNMSLATRKYMKKYGLIEPDGDDDESDDEDSDSSDVFQRDSTSVGASPLLRGTSRTDRVVDRHKRELSHERQRPRELSHERQRPRELSHERQQPRELSHERQRPMDLSRERNHHQRDSSRERPRRQPRGQDEQQARQRPASVNLSELKNNLGETLDMLLPFLRDLERNSQHGDCSTSSEPVMTSSTSDQLPPPRHHPSRRVYDPRGYDSSAHPDDDDDVMLADQNRNKSERRGKGDEAPSVRNTNSSISSAPPVVCEPATATSPRYQRAGEFPTNISLPSTNNNTGAAAAQVRQQPAHARPPDHRSPHLQPHNTRDGAGRHRRRTSAPENRVLSSQVMRVLGEKQQRQHRERELASAAIDDGNPRHERARDSRLASCREQENSSPRDDDDDDIDTGRGYHGDDGGNILDMNKIKQLKKLM